LRHTAAGSRDTPATFGQPADAFDPRRRQIGFGLNF
jgi:hypothetical protein